MKEVKAIVQPFKLSKVVEALHQIPGLPGATVSKVQGFGRGKAIDSPHGFVEDLVSYVPKVKIEIVVNDEMLDEVIKTIIENAHTGNKGDGKIFVYDVAETIRIRTGDKGEDAV